MSLENGNEINEINEKNEIGTIYLRVQVMKCVFERPCNGITTENSLSVNGFSCRFLSKFLAPMKFESLIYLFIFSSCFGKIRKLTIVCHYKSSEVNKFINCYCARSAVYINTISTSKKEKKKHLSG